MNIKTRALVIGLILFADIGLDRVTKIVAKQNLPKYDVISLLGDTIRLQAAENTGAFLSLGADIPGPTRYILFTLLVGVFLTGMLLYLLASKALSRFQVASLSLVLGGGFGNLIDRLLHEGRVFDFLNVGIGRLRTGIFNVADMSITFGVLWFLILAFMNRDGDAASGGNGAA